MANVLRNFSIRKLGLGAGSGLRFASRAFNTDYDSLTEFIYCSSGITMLVSFIWGNFAFARGTRPPIKSIFGSIIALELLFAGIFAVGLAYSDRIQMFIRAKKWPWLTRFERPPKSAQIETDLKETIIGFVVVIFAGIFNGSSLIPMRLAKDVDGIGFIISFSIGVVIATPVVVFIYYAIILREWPKFHFKKWIIPLYATGSGIMWNVGNLSSIYATWTLGFTIGFPITQLSLGVAAFWGLVLFKEIRGKLELLTYLLGVALLVAGAFMLGTFA